MTEMKPVPPGPGYSNVLEVRKFIGVPLARLSDADLERAIDLGDSQINLLTGRVWRQQPVYETLDSTGYPSLRLGFYPVASIQKVEVYRSGEWQELEEWDPDSRTGDWRLQKASAGILEWTRNPPAKARDSIRASYVYGYAETPGYIRDLSIRMASILALQMDSGQVNPGGYQSISEGALSLSWGSGAHDGRIRLLLQETEKIIEQIGGRMTYVWSK